MGKQDSKRLRLLEAVAEAATVDARAWVDFFEVKGETFAHFVSRWGDQLPKTGRAVLEALAALEAYDEQAKTA